MSDLPPPGQTYRATAILYAILSLLIVLVAALSGGGLAKAAIVAVAFFVVATGWSWFRLRQRARRAPPREPGASRRERPAVSAALVEELVGDLGAIRAPRGTRLHAGSWQTEAPLRMLLNNLDPEVAEHPSSLVVYGGSGRAARSHDALRAIVTTLLRLRDDETLLVQSGKPVGVFRTHERAPRVLIANSLLVPAWANWDEFRRLEAAGLTMFGQMTAGSWIYIGTQGILQGTYQTFCAAAQTHFGTPDLAGRTILTSGLGGMGGAQPLAATMAGAAILCVEVDQRSIDRRLVTRYVDEQADDLEDALARVRGAAADRRPLSVAVAGTPRTCFLSSPPAGRLSTSSPTRPRHTTR